VSQTILVIASIEKHEAGVGRPEHDGAGQGWESSQAHRISGLGR